MPCGRNRCSPPAKAGSALGPVDVTTLPWLEKVDGTLARRFCRSQTSTITTILAFNPGQGGGSGAVVSNEKNIANLMKVKPYADINILAIKSAEVVLDNLKISNRKHNDFRKKI